MDWTDLPEELLSLVLSKLFPKDRKTFGLVSKPWRAVANRSPWLMFYPRNEQKWKFIQSDSNVVFYKNFPELDNAEIRCSKYGWLLMSRDDFTLFFFDPSDSMMIELPKMNHVYTTISFFDPPTSPHCFIFGIANQETSTSLSIGMLKRGEDKWTCYSFDSKFIFPLSSCTPVLHRGFLYFLDVWGNIATFNINGQFSLRSWMVYTKCLSPPPQFGRIKQHFLFKIHGKKMIFVVFVEHDEGKVNVFRLREPGMKWELVEDLGDKMLFVTHSATFAKTAPKESMANKIYFPMFRGDKGVFYSLDTRKYYSFDGDYTNISSYGLKALRFATWYAPLPTLELAEKLTSWHP
ncbi:hypothetical protein BUALT_Bualt14G0120900 [Buddleja alternifolia]|uniref:F-box domain-containing protein n=1 Tax=Buddleja alternifolia TaxID=168488 RepID=A0AAV6WQE2_9LAMI|nr:hypothetical protein BUALT_Bualt14G0120900 [Buddleja alternifolia]